MSEDRVKQLITRPEPHGFGIDVGWRLFDRDGQSLEIWWGNTRDRQSLKELIEDCRRHGYVFTYDEEQP